MAPLSRVYITELWKLFKRPMTLTLAIILVALVVLIYGILIATIVVPESMGIEVDADSGIGGLEASLLLPDGLYMGIGLVQLLVTALVIVLAAGMVGSDLSWGTVRTMLLLGAGRVRLLVAKILALATFGLFGLIIGLVLAILGSITTGLVVGEGLLASEWLTGAFLIDAATVATRALVGIVLWALVAGTLTLVTQSIPAGLGTSLALLLIGGQIGGLLGQLGTVGTWISRALPNAGVDAVTQLNATIPPTYATSDWAWILANLIGWTSVLAAAAVTVFRRMDTLAAGS
jgi:ABC-2 type transport system permease protein